MDDKSLEMLFPVKQPLLHPAELVIYSDFNSLLSRAEGPFTYGLLNDWVEYSGAERWQADLMLYLEDVLVKVKEEFKKEIDKWTSSHSS